MSAHLNGRLSIITGPLFTAYDRWFDPTHFDVAPGRIPAEFWKIIYYIDRKKYQRAGENILGCQAYLVSQDERSMRDKSGSDNLSISTLTVALDKIAKWRC